jgi:hypothetical protein
MKCYVHNVFWYFSLQICIYTGCMPPSFVYCVRVSTKHLQNSLNLTLNNDNKPTYW